MLDTTWFGISMESMCVLGVWICTHREEHVKVAGLLDAVTDAGELVLLIQTANKNVEPSIVRLLIQVLVNVE
jgi:hypothetical protein